MVSQFRFLHLFVVSVAVFGATAAVTRAQEKPGETVERVVEKGPTFLQQLQESYQQAKDAGLTTANSAGHWLSEQYDGATRSASSATNSATRWVSGMYGEAVKAGDTTARSATEWVSEDVGKIGTWQYRVVKVEVAKVEAKLNEMGAQRWECFSVNWEGMPTLVFKRRHRSYLQQLPAKDLLKLIPMLQGGDDSAE